MTFKEELNDFWWVIYLLFNKIGRYRVFIFIPLLLLPFYLSTKTTNFLVIIVPWLFISIIFSSIEYVKKEIDKEIDWIG